MLFRSTTVNAQTVFDKDITITEPYEIADYNNSETHVVIDGATVTFGNEAMNTCGLPFGDGTQIILENGAKLVFFNSPDNWYPDPESDANEDFADYMYDANSNIITSVLYNFVVEGSATIVCDSKCHFGGTVCGGGELTLFVGDSTIINNDLDAYLEGVEGEHG